MVGGEPHASPAEPAEPVGGAIAAESKPARAAHPLRDTLEAVALSISMALVLKHFFVEAYKIPSGSMQPNLIGSPELGVFDRILVDKLAYRSSDPQRFDIAIFRYPLDRSKIFVKRVVGLPGEQLRIQDGDVWTRADSALPWRVLRRPRSVQASTWKRLDLLAPERNSWQITLGGGDAPPGRSLRLEDGARASFRPDEGAILDDYRDGYEDGLREHMQAFYAHSNEHPVGDLRVEARVRAEAGCRELVFVLQEGPLRYRFELPGPAAAADARPAIEVRSGELALEPPKRAIAARPWKLAAGASARIGVQNLDDRLELDLEGEVALGLEIDGSSDQRSGAWIDCAGGRAELDELMLLRDIYYTADYSKTTETAIPPGCYFMLGDNTQASTDSREWTLKRYLVEPEGGSGARSELRGNWENGVNPAIVVGRLDEPELFFRDEWGELHYLLQSRTEPIAPLESPFVPREMILGRALAVFWPPIPAWGVWRWKWIR